MSRKKVLPLTSPRRRLRPLLDALPHSFTFFHVDLKTGSGFDAVSLTFGQPDVVVNCAALSVPRVCEKDPDSAMSINVPSSLVIWLSSFSEKKGTLLIHLSTDQVYEGVKSFYKEEDETNPVNVYGKSKVAAEKFISEKCSNFAILRSSIIYGPQTISPVPKSLPVQWIDSVLANGDARWLSEGKQMQLLLNVGGPDRVSRVQMAQVVADIRGYNPSLIKPVSASSVDRGVMSPADISMDITKLVQTLNIHPVAYKDGAKLTLAA
ncbi:Methionine adenosyltransferase 2 subunit beta [Melia azedarach]|uniref:Methionine adenosyltransferase 2 subunit beta n=1 Tax=Melia azedarach TaxID=155640 RepID=A0ACC1YWK4_MELAZ|nr:Methionine adenosyltransferase 2 subunit beta [Melia azedarach]